MLVTAGDPARRTGGNLYDRHMLAALRRAGVRVTTVVLRDRDSARIADLRAPLVLVDTIAAPFAAPHLARLRATGTEVVALAHMGLGARALARRADRVIAVGRALARDLVDGGIDRRRILVVSPGRDRVLARSRAKRGQRVLCVANWTPTKGIHALVAAVARLPDVSLDLVGDAPDAAYARAVRHGIAARGLAGRVRIHGSLSRAAVMRRYATASVFALPSTREGYPIAYMEALSHGLPVVGYDIPAVREVVGGAGILVAPGRVAALGAALQRVLSDDGSWGVQARRSIARARELPTWAESEERFVRAITGPRANATGS